MAVCLQLLYVLGLVSTFCVGIPSEKSAVQVKSSCSLSKDFSNNDFVKVGEGKPCVSSKSEISLLCNAVRNLTNLYCGSTSNDKGNSFDILKDVETVAEICTKFGNILGSKITEVIAKSKLSDPEKCKALCDKNNVLCVFANKIIEDILFVTTTTTTTTTTLSTESPPNPDGISKKGVSTPKSPSKPSTTASTAIEEAKSPTTKALEATAKEQKNPEVLGDPKSLGENENSNNPDEETQPHNKEKTNKDSEDPPIKQDNTKTGEKPISPGTNEKPESMETKKPHDKNAEADKEKSDKLTTSTMKNEDSNTSDAKVQSTTSVTSEEAKKPVTNVDYDQHEDDPDEDEKVPQDYDDGNGIYSDDKKGNKEEQQDPSMGDKNDANAEDGMDNTLTEPDGDLNGEIHTSGGVARNTVGVDLDDGDSHFFVYFITVVGLSALLYIVFHNKKKILALILEGRNNRGRRPNSSLYRKLDNNLDEVISSSTKKVNTGNIIY